MAAAGTNSIATLNSSPSIEPAEFRATLGHFCSGVTVVAGFDEDGAPVGLACQSFSSLSLSPPLVLVCVGEKSTSWPRIERSGRFSVNVLAQDQWDLCAALGRPGVRKFEGVPWRRTGRGALILDDVIAWIDCDIDAVHAGGDHRIVIGAVRDVAIARNHAPLVFFRGEYGLPDSVAQLSR